MKKDKENSANPAPATNRVATIERNTKETQIKLAINLDGNGNADVKTGVPFLDHMLNLLARHGLFDLKIDATGDIEVDYHHTVEDVGIVLGNAIKQALASKIGINRYGFFILPMDETLVRVALDLSDRPYFVYNVPVKNPMIRDFNICLVREFFLALANNLGCNLHIQLEYGEEPHHIAEAIFKCFAKSLMNAVAINPRSKNVLPSTKEVL